MGVKPLAFPEKWTVADPVSFAKLPDRGDHSRRKRSNSTKPHQFRQLQPTAAAARSGASRSAAPPKKIPGYTLCPIAGHRHRVFRICWCGGKTHQLVLGIYTLTTAFPKAETYGLSLQIRRLPYPFRPISQKDSDGAVPPRRSGFSTWQRAPWRRHGTI